MTNAISRARRGRRACFIAGLAGLLTLWPGAALAGRKGVEIKVMLVDGGRVSGELIAVRKDTIIVKSLVYESTIAIADIDAIVVAKNAGGSAFAQTLGTFAGMALGWTAAIAYGRWYNDKHDGIPIWALPVGVAGGAWLGRAAGGWISGKEGRGKLYPIKGQPPDTVARTMAKLRRKARLRVAYG